MRKRLIAVLLATLLWPCAPQAHGDAPAMLGKPALRQGARGGAVRSLQTLLAASGFAPGSPDGIFGPATADAVRKAQAHFGLTVDGVVGPATAGALHAAGAGAKGGAPAAELASHSPEDRPAFRQLVVFTADTGSLATVSRAERERFALTFHGDPDPEVTPAILALLSQYGAKATFFLHGDAALLQPGLVAQMAAAGHEIGNYGMRYREMTRLSTASLQADLLQAGAAIRAASGTEPVFFRPPGGEFHQRLKEAAEQIGLRLVMWTNIGARDTGAATAATLAPRLAESLYPGAVIMLHGDRPLALEVLPALLEAMATQSLTSVTLSALYAAEVGTPASR